MKEHPVDTYFSTRLSGSIEPSKDLWSRIETEVHPQPKGLAWRKVMGYAAIFVLIPTLWFLRPSTETRHYTPDLEEASFTNRTETNVPVIQEKQTLDTEEEKPSAAFAQARFADYQGDEWEFSDQTIHPIDPIQWSPSKSSRTVVMTVYSTPKQKPETEKATYGKELVAYTRTQWDNLKKGEKLNAPPTPKVKVKKPRFLP